MSLRKAAEMALARLEHTIAYSNEEMAKIDEAKHALRQALAQEQKKDRVGGLEMTALQQIYRSNGLDLYLAIRRESGMIKFEMPFQEDFVLDEQVLPDLIQALKELNND